MVVRLLMPQLSQEVSYLMFGTLVSPPELEAEAIPIGSSSRSDSEPILAYRCFSDGPQRLLGGFWLGLPLDRSWRLRLVHNRHCILHSAYPSWLRPSDLSWPDRSGRGDLGRTCCDFPTSLVGEAIRDPSNGRRGDSLPSSANSS